MNYVNLKKFLFKFFLFKFLKLTLNLQVNYEYDENLNGVFKTLKNKIF